jgi:hypothetical protein
MKIRMLGDERIPVTAAKVFRIMSRRGFIEAGSFQWAVYRLKDALKYVTI